MTSSIREHKDWLASNQDADKSEYEQHLKDLQSVCDTIIEKIYKQGGDIGDNNDEPEDRDL
jgi:heat shock protein 5